MLVEAKLMEAFTLVGEVTPEKVEREAASSLAPVEEHSAPLVWLRELLEET